MAELPMLALTLHRVAMPMPIGSGSGGLMFAGMMRRPAAISSRTSSAEIFSRLATYTISSVVFPWRAKCICDRLESPESAASCLRFTIHSARGWRISRVAFCLRPLVVMVYPWRKIVLRCLVCLDEFRARPVVVTMLNTCWDYKLMRAEGMRVSHLLPPRGGHKLRGERGSHEEAQPEPQDRGGRRHHPGSGRIPGGNRRQRHQEL